MAPNLPPVFDWIKRAHGPPKNRHLHPPGIAKPSMQAYGGFWASRSHSGCGLRGDAGYSVAVKVRKPSAWRSPGSARQKACRAWAQQAVGVVQCQQVLVKQSAATRPCLQTAGGHFLRPLRQAMLSMAPLQRACCARAWNKWVCRCPAVANTRVRVRSALAPQSGCLPHAHTGCYAGVQSPGQRPLAPWVVKMVRSSCCSNAQLRRGLRQIAPLSSHCDESHPRPGAAHPATPAPARPPHHAR